MVIPIGCSQARADGRDLEKRLCPTSYRQNPYRSSSTACLAGEVLEAGEAPVNLLPGRGHRVLAAAVPGVLEYLPKGAELRIFDQDDLDAIAAELDNRPRTLHGYRTPAETCTEILNSGDALIP
ncbi:hypothetical protein [Streptosporangium sandarakinum]|uniref:hypothetical protein n=1 Tax=Streptosporangium sandarakinum TaxID=1260955 RepID=UPI00341D0BFA